MIYNLTLHFTIFHYMKKFIANERLHATRRILVKNKKSHSQNSNTELRMGKSLDSILY